MNVRINVYNCLIISNDGSVYVEAAIYDHVTTSDTDSRTSGTIQISAQQSLVVLFLSSTMSFRPSIESRFEQSMFAQVHEASLACSDDLIPKLRLLFNWLYSFRGTCEFSKDFRCDISIYICTSFSIQCLAICLEPSA